MVTKSDIKPYLIRASVEYEELGENTWVIRGHDNHVADTIIVANDPIVVFRMKVMKLPEKNEMDFMRKLLQLNATEMLYASFGLEENTVVVGGAQPLENLDYNEFQAMLDDLDVAITIHYQTLKQAAEA